MILDFQCLKKVGLVFEFRLVAGNGGIDQEEVQRLEGDILSDFVKSVHLCAIVDESVGGTDVLQFKTTG